MKNAIVLFFIIKLIYLHCKNFRKYRKVVGKSMFKGQILSKKVEIKSLDKTYDQSNEIERMKFNGRLNSKYI